MRNYQLYLIEDEFASHYFGRERVFYQLFSEYRGSEGEFRVIVRKQIDYITKPMPVLRIHQIIHRQLERVKGFRPENGTYIIEVNGKRSKATLSVFDNKIIIHSEGSFEAETAFFEVLRKCESSFLALDLDNNKYGWLNPIKERKFV